MLFYFRFDISVKADSSSHDSSSTLLSPTCRPVTTNGGWLSAKPAGFTLCSLCPPSSGLRSSITSTCLPSAPWCLYVCTLAAYHDDVRTRCWELISVFSECWQVFCSSCTSSNLELIRPVVTDPAEWRWVTLCLIF